MSGRAFAKPIVRIIRKLLRALVNTKKKKQQLREQTLANRGPRKRRRRR